MKQINTFQVEPIKLYGTLQFPYSIIIEWSWSHLIFPSDVMFQDIITTRLSKYETSLH